jgi:hypothetical protein
MGLDPNVLAQCQRDMPQAMTFLQGLWALFSSHAFNAMLYCHNSTSKALFLYYLSLNQ